MNNIEKLRKAKNQYDELEAIRLKASSIFNNDKYLVCVHLHYTKIITISCAINTKDGNHVYASFEMMLDTGNITPVERRNYSEIEIDEMLMFLENILAQ